jgi:hypothetical protein
MHLQLGVNASRPLPLKRSLPTKASEAVYVHGLAERERERERESLYTCLVTIVSLTLNSRQSTALQAYGINTVRMEWTAGAWNFCKVKSDCCHTLVTAQPTY